MQNCSPLAWKAWGWPASARQRHIEGLRAIAVIAVVGYHVGLPGFAGGFVGVDVFFVISGYVICGHITSLKDRGELDIFNFWLRRIARLAPAGIFVVAVVGAVGLATLPQDRALQLAAAILPAAGFTANLHFIAVASDYHSAMAALNPLLHMWSLGVEAQFYVIWPLAALLMAPRFRVAGVVLIGLTSLAVSAAVTPTHPTLAYYGLPSRLWEMAAGAALVLSGRRAPAWAAAVGIAAIILAVMWFDAATPFPGYAAVLPVLGALLAIAAPSPMLGGAGLVWIGARSYSWYLWHWPLIVFSEMIQSGLYVRLAASGIALAFAAITWALIEEPARKWGRRWAAI
ncbi:acyltransferase family protein [Methylocella sp.]|uniref:acyltransferase family protein n=1 Tax=Methylocella sp. TaxID=1978226 RepID=UPI0037848055